MIASLYEKFMRRRVYLLLLLEAAFVVSARLLPYKVLYLYFFFYLILIVFCRRFLTEEPPEDAIRLKDGRLFWLALVLTVLGMMVAYYIRQEVWEALTGWSGNSGVISVWVRNPPGEYALYAVTMLLLKPLAEGLFYRRALISFGSRAETALTVCTSLCLYIIIHINGWAGLPVLLIPMIPLTISYLTTKNIHIALIAHVVFCFQEDLLYIINAIARMYIQ